MPPRPFPYQLRIGIDVCNVPRIRNAISRSGAINLPILNLFLRRVLTSPERAYFWNRFGTEAHTKPDAVSQFLAGRFAAKEAIRKACDHLPSYSRGFHEIIILPIVSAHPQEHQSAAPQGLILDHGDCETQANLTDQQPDDKGSIREILARKAVRVNDLSGQICEVSISHDGDFAAAVAMVPRMHKQISKRAVI